MIGEFVKVTLATWGATARTLLAQLRAAGSEGADDAAEAFDAVEVLQPLGLRANPVLRATTEALVIERGDERLVIHLVDKSRQTGAVEPEAGGVVVHSLAAQASVIYWRASGAIEVTAGGVAGVTITAGGVVRLQDGSQPFVRGTDYATALGTFLAAYKVANTALGTFATAVGVAVPAVAVAAATLNTALGVANTAADALVTAAGTYLSTRVTGQ